MTEHLITSKHHTYSLYNLQEFGILNKLYKDGVQNLRECLKPASSNTLRPFDLVDFYGIFCVYLGGELHMVVETGN